MTRCVETRLISQRFRLMTCAASRSRFACNYGHLGRSDRWGALVARVLLATGGTAEIALVASERWNRVVI